MAPVGFPCAYKLRLIVCPERRSWTGLFSVQRSPISEAEAESKCLLCRFNYVRGPECVGPVQTLPLLPSIHSGQAWCLFSLLLLQWMRQLKVISIRACCSLQPHCKTACSRVRGAGWNALREPKPPTCCVKWCLQKAVGPSWLSGHGSQGDVMEINGVMLGLMMARPNCNHTRLIHRFFLCWSGWCIGEVWFSA